MSRISFILLIIACVASLSSAERLYDEVVFEKSTCEMMGSDYTTKFDVCAMMEFCEDPEAELPERNDRRLIHEDDSGYPLSAQSTTNVDLNFAQEAELAEHKHNEGDNESREHHKEYTSKTPKARFGWRLPGKECLWPGPIMRLKRGSNHGLFVRGSGGNTTNLHFHGLHAAGHGNGDDIRRKLQGNDVLIYGIDLPADKHMGGTHWYHSHLFGEAWDQVLGGAYGMIVVGDEDHDVGTKDGNVLAFLDNERIMVLDDTHGKWNVNGNQDELEEYTFRKGEWYRLRILMVSADGHSSGAHVQFGGGCETRAIAHDGILRFEVPKEKQRLFAMTSSSRLDVAIRCSKYAKLSVYGEDVAEFRVRERDDSRRLGDGDHDENKKRHKGILPSPFEKGEKSWKSLRLPYIQDLRNSEVDNTWDIRVKGSSLNGLVYDPEKPLCNADGTDFEYGTVQEWTLHGTRQHPVHVHLYPMQIVTDFCGDGHDTGEFYDSILSDVYMRNKNYPCRVRARLIDVAGPVLAHCHILFHAERGAQGWFHVVNGPTQPDFPRVHSCGNNSTNCDPPNTFNKCTDN